MFSDNVKTGRDLLTCKYILDIYYSGEFIRFPELGTLISWISRSSFDLDIFLIYTG